MKIGFIGTGHITKSVIHGILGSKLKIRRIIVSKRNNKISSSLKRKSKKILVLNNNQEIINNSNWIFLSVTPEVGHKILPELKFKKNKTIISFISTIKMKDLKKYTNMKSKIFRAIPLPPISIRKGPIPLYPPNKSVKKFFDHLGTTVEIENENLSLNFWSTSSMMAPFYELLNTLSIWLYQKGISKSDAQKWAKDQEVLMQCGQWSRSKEQAFTLHSLITKYKNEITPKKRGFISEDQRLRRLLK